VHILLIILGVWWREHPNPQARNTTMKKKLNCRHSSRIIRMIKDEMTKEHGREVKRKKLKIGRSAVDRSIWRVKHG
jgi:hypothetical protein